MTLSDGAVERLRAAVRAPDLAGTRYPVYEAEDTALGRNVALKVLELPDEGGALEARLVAEARVLGLLEHPGIVPVHDVGTLEDGRVFYAMKRVEGERLDIHVARVGSLAERLRLFLRVAETVAFAHARGVLHRDLKPQNVMVGAFGEVLVIDWGLAKALGEEPGAAGAVLGTPGYMSPEQLAGAAVDARSDVWSLGALLAFLLGAPASGVAPKRVPRALRAIAAKAQAREREARYPSVEALAADVSAYLAGEPVAADPEGPARRLGRLLVRHRVAVFLVLAYLAARVLVLLFVKR